MAVEHVQQMCNKNGPVMTGRERTEPSRSGEDANAQKKVAIRDGASTGGIGGHSY
jgi:hypothetical protein